MQQAVKRRGLARLEDGARPLRREDVVERGRDVRVEGVQHEAHLHDSEVALLDQPADRLGEIHLSQLD